MSSFLSICVDGDVVVMYLGTDTAMPVIPDSQSRLLDYNVCINQKTEVVWISICWVDCLSYFAFMFIHV